MDRLNNLILSELMQNSRTSIKTIAKKLKTSREVVNYRINKLIKDKIILSFTTEINYKKLGFIAGSIYLNIEKTKQKEFIEYLSNTNYISWAVEFSGIWNFGFSIIGKTNDEIDYKFQQMYNQFKEHIINHRFTIHKNTNYFYEKFFDMTNNIKIKNNNKVKNIKIDTLDKIILKELANYSRIELTKLSKKIKISPPAISKRIKVLEKNEYIIKYNIFVDISKLNFYQYEIFITNYDNEIGRASCRERV